SHYFSHPSTSTHINNNVVPSVPLHSRSISASAPRLAMAAKFNLAALPGELRNSVYQFAGLVDQSGMEVTLDPANGNQQVKVIGASTGNPSVLTAFSLIGDKNLYQEAKLSVFRENLFKIQEHKYGTAPYVVTRAFLKAIGSRGRDEIQHIQLVKVGSLLKGYDWENEDVLVKYPAEYVHKAIYTFQIIATHLCCCKKLQTLDMELELCELFGGYGADPWDLVAWEQRHSAARAAVAKVQANPSGYDPSIEEAMAAAQRELALASKESGSVAMTILALLVTIAKNSGLKALKIAWKDTNDRKVLGKLIHGGKRWPDEDQLKAAAEQFLRTSLEPTCSLQVVVREHVEED
ncbi:hypothetical protein BU16DRAFT_604303, partial [Lophium mytilinum]